MGDYTVKTALCEKLGIKYPIMLAGMSGVSHADLVAAVSIAGGIGSIGGLTLSPKVLRHEIAEVKKRFKEAGNVNLPFGVDLAIPDLGPKARKTNHDYTHGKLPELIDIIIEEKASLFICAVGIPPEWAVKKLHDAGIPIMNMVGAPKHVDKALNAGVDMICAQGTEAGGHCGEIGTMALTPQCIDRCRGRTSALGGPILVVAAGGIVNGRHMAAAFNLGAVGVWVGTRFVASEESHASDRHKQSVVKATALDTTRTLIYSGRPLRTYRTPYVNDWETNKKSQIEELCSKGVIPFNYDVEQHSKEDKPFSLAQNFPQLFGQGAGSITSIEPASKIVQDMMKECIETLRESPKLIARI